MSDECIITAETPFAMRFTGGSLAATITAQPVTIALTGELGTGKTTFLQGFAHALGVREHLTSPTYALEQRYQTPRGELLHIDLYRTDERQARELLRASEQYTGIRCIEWSERIGLEQFLRDGHVIAIAITEEGKNRRVTCAFHDATIPSDAEIDRWWQDARTPAHILAHCSTVAALCDRFADALSARGQIIRSKALHAAARLHDLLRFIDFHAGGKTGHRSVERDMAHWKSIAARYPGKRHEDACAQFLSERDFPSIARIVATHGLTSPPRADATIEERLLYYADKRVIDDRVVTIAERFADFAKRYGNGTVSAEHRRWHAQVKAVEKALFPDGPPF